MKETVFIYGLHDPRDGQLRYIGASKDLSKRLVLHFCPASLRPDSPKNQWLNELVKAGIRPTVSVIEEATKENWRTRERFWIQHHRERGASLTNTHPGGEGGARTTGKKWTEDRRTHISQMFKGHRVSQKVRDAGKRNIRKAIAAHRTPLDDARLTALYSEQKKSSREVAEILGCGQGPVLRRLHELNLMRSLSESSQIRWARNKSHQRRRE
jgi:hypothetical protein